MRKYTYEEVKIKIESYGCKLISDEYVNNSQKLKMICSCGSEFNKTLKVMGKSGLYMCNFCCSKISTSKQTRSYENVKDEIEKYGHKLLTEKSEYTNTNYKLEIMCDKGHIYNKRINDFRKGVRCNVCSLENKSKKQRTDFREIKELVKSVGYVLLSNESDYKNNDSKLEMKCEKGHIFKQRYSNFKKRKTRCPKCFDERRKFMTFVSYKERKEYVENFGFKLLTKEEDYINANQKCKFMCDKGHIYYTKMHDFKAGNRCPICKKSKGETEIKRFLINKNLNFEEEFKFDDCKFKRKLPFDFYLPEYNICIEYDGRQHFEIAKAFGGLEAFIDTKIRDTIKNEYCKNNNIKLIRIPYWELNNIENILSNKLNIQ